MNGFIKTMAFGLAALCLLLLAAGVTTLMMLKSNGSLSPKALRDLVLSQEEKEFLEARRHRPAEAPDVPPKSGGPQAISEEDILAQIADLANASHVSQLVVKLRRQQQALDERQAYLDQQWADLQLAKAGFERIQRQDQEQEEKLKALAKQQEDERARWAAAQAAEAGRIQVFGEVEKGRYRDQAKLFEMMKDNAWQSLKRFEPREIARYLALMDAKKAARLLMLAQQDSEYPNAAVAISKEMLRLDLDNASGDQVERLASLYSFMPAEQILPYLKDSRAEDIAGIMRAMAKSGQLKKRAELMEALRKEDSKREMDVRRLLEQGPDPAAAPAPGGAPAPTPKTGKAPGV